MATNKEFLAQKIANYKKFLKDNSEEPTKVDEMAEFTPEMYLAFASQNLLPLAESNQLNIAVDKTMEHFKLKNVAEVRQKLTRYYEFLVDFLKTVQ